MAGHSKWANNKYRKANKDAKKDKIFSKIIRELVVAVKLGGNNVNCNPRLRTAIYKALSNNMTRNTLNKAISRNIDKQNNFNTEFKNIVYEGYGPNGIAFIIKCFSNNSNRTASTIRNFFSKIGGNLGNTGSVLHLFSKKGIILFPPGFNQDNIIDIAINVNAEDVINNKDGSINVFTEPNSLIKIKNIFESKGFVAKLSKIVFIPLSYVNLDNTSIIKLTSYINQLNNCNDVIEIYHNSKLVINN